MTRREWEDELKKYLIDLPESECDRVLEYYEELYEDKRELNMKPQNIINEFGNPLDVAQKILEEYRENIDDYRFEPKRDIKSETTAFKAEPAPEVKAEKVEKEKKSGGEAYGGYADGKNPFRKGRNRDTVADRIAKASEREKNNYKGDMGYGAQPNPFMKPYSDNKVKLFDVLLSIIYIAFCIALGFAGVIYVLTCIGIMLGGVATVVFSIIGEIHMPNMFIPIGVGVMIFAVGLFLSALSGLWFKLSTWCAHKVNEHVNKQKTKIYSRRQQL